MSLFKRRMFKFGYLALPVSIFLFAGLVYLKYPLFLDKIYQEFGYLHAHLNKKEVNTANYKFSYVERGEGPTILFVHGFRSDKNNWLKYVRRMKGGYNYIAIDLPYHGETACKRKVKFNIKNMAVAINEFVQAKKLGNFYLVGTSLGAGFTLEYARCHPDKVRKVVLINPFALRPPASKLRSVVERNKRIFSPENLSQLDYLFVCMKGSPLQLPGNLKNYFLEKIRSKNELGKKMLEEVSQSEGLEKYLPKIKTPVLILQGTKDRVVDKQDRFVYQKLMPNLKYVEIEDGHHLFLKKDLKMAILEIRKFFAQ